MKKFMMLIILFVLTLVSPKVEACVLTYDEYTAANIKTSMVVGEYVFNTFEGYSPSLEDIAIASRTIPAGQNEHIYVISNYGSYYVLDMISEYLTTDKSEFPDLDVTYEYFANIRNASEEQYDYFTCRVDWIDINYTILETEGEEEYKTKATRTVNISSDNGVGSAKYCLTSGNECVPDKEAEVNAGIMKVEYETALGGQRVCVEATDRIGNTSGVVCDEELVYVDKDEATIRATEELGTVIEKKPHTIEELFEINFSVSGGELTYYYYTEEDGVTTKHLLTNLADLPSGSILVEVRAIGGNGLVSRQQRTIEVIKNKVTYNYAENGGTSSDIEEYETVYKGKARLSVTAYKEGYEFIGWNTDKDATIGLDSVEVTEAMTLYAIFRKEITANFAITSQSNATQAISEYQAFKCELYNKESKCTVTVPTISAKVGYIAEGWSKEEFSKEVDYHGGETIEITGDTTIYSVTREKTDTTVSFITYDGSQVINTVLRCNKYNGESTCTVDPSSVVNEAYNGMQPVGYTDDLQTINKIENFEVSTGKRYYAYYKNNYEVSYVSGNGETETEQTDVHYIMDIENVKQIVDPVTVADPKTVDGYTFIGYKEGNEFGDVEVQPGDVVTVSKNTTYNAIYEKNVTLSYGLSEEDEQEGTVTGLPDGASGKAYYLSSTNTTIGFKVALDSATEVAKPRNVFLYWLIGQNDYHDAGEEVEINEDTTVVPTWIVDGCRVIFDYATNGGVSATKTSMTYYTGDEDFDVTLVSARKPGWEFIGWATRSDVHQGKLSSTWRPSTAENEVVVYAMFRKELTVNYVVQDSERFSANTDSEQITLYNAETGIDIQMRDVALRSGYDSSDYEFIKWTKDKDDTSEDNGYAIGESVFVTENTTFYTVTKDLNPLTGNFYYMNNEKVTSKKVNCYRYNGSSTCEIEEPTIESTYQNGVLTGFSSSSSEETEIESLVIDENTDYYGVYDRILTVNYHSGTEASSVVTELVDMKYIISKTGANAKSASIELNLLDGITGFTSLGWREDEEAKDPTYLALEILSITDDKDYYGVYEKEITVSYAAMGGTTTPDSETKTTLYNTVDDATAVTIDFTLADAPTRRGYRFSGWDAGNTGTMYDEGETVSLSESTKMYAIWRGRSYTVTYDYSSNGGTSATSSTDSVVYLGLVDLSVQATKPDWEFVGWSENPDSKEVVKELEMPAEDITLYAVFRYEIIAHWLLTDINAGTIEKDTTSCYKYNNETECRINTGNLIANAGYVASGWTTEQDSIKVQTGNNATTTISEEKTYYSISRLSSPLEGIFYYGTEEDILTSAKTNCQLYNGATKCTINAPLTPTLYKDGVFNEWSESSEEVVDATFELTENKSYYAHYIKPILVTYHEGLTDEITVETKTAEYLISETSDNEQLPTFEIKVPNAVDTYTTLGWTEDDENVIGEIIEEGGYDKVVSYSLELYGRYNREISLSYDSDGGNTTPDTETATQDAHSLLGITSHTFVVADAVEQVGAAFEGWKLSTDEESSYKPADEITIKENTELKAIWNWKKVPTLAVSEETVNTIYDTKTATNTVDYDGDGELSVTSSDTDIATVTISEKTITVSPGSKYGTTTITVNATEGEAYRAGTVTFTVINRLTPTISVTNTSVNDKTITMTYTYNGDGEITAVSSNTKLATIDKVDTTNKTVTVTALTVGQVRITINASEGENYAAVSTYKEFTFGSVASSNSTAFQEALTTWGTIGSATDANWYGSTDDSNILEPDGSYVILESVNTGNYTGYYFKEKQADGTYAVPSYEDITIDFDMTSTNGDDDAIGAMIRFNPESTANYWTGYMMFLDNHSSGSGIGAGKYNGIWRANNNPFNTTFTSSGVGTMLTEVDITKIWERNKWQHYRIQALGNTITIWRWDTNATGVYEATDDAILFQAVDDSENAVATGTYGFWCYSQPYAQFKNFAAITGDPDNFEITVH